jgi:hypothetical protein
VSEIVEIAEESKQYVDEWLLFEVTELDDRQLPAKGRLLCHDKSRDEIHEVAMKNLGKDLMTAFTGEPIPPDMYACCAITSCQPWA